MRGVWRKGHFPYLEPKDEEMGVPTVLGKTSKGGMNPWLLAAIGMVIFGAAVEIGLI